MNINKLDRLLESYKSTSGLIKEFSYGLFGVYGFVLTLSDKFWPAQLESYKHILAFWCTISIFLLIACFYTQILLKNDISALWHEAEVDEAEVVDTSVSKRLRYILLKTHLEILFFSLACGPAFYVALIFVSCFDSIKTAVGIPLFILAIILIVLSICFIIAVLAKLLCSFLKLLKSLFSDHMVCCYIVGSILVIAFLLLLCPLISK